MRHLLTTALRLRHGKAQSSLPEQLMSVFVQYYRRLDRQDRLALLRTLTASFGVQAEEVDAAAATWRALRQHQQAAGGGGGVSGSSAGSSAGPGNVAAPGQEPLLKAAAQLAAAATPLYSRLFVPLSQQKGGIKFLADMRADLLQARLLFVQFAFVPFRCLPAAEGCEGHSGAGSPSCSWGRPTLPCLLHACFFRSPGLPKNCMAACVASLPSPAPPRLPAGHPRAPLGRGAAAGAVGRPACLAGRVVQCRAAAAAACQLGGQQRGAA